MGTLLRTQRFLYQKRGNRPDEIEDVVSWKGGDVELGDRSCRFALADGATTGAYSQEWAQWLVTEIGSTTAWTSDEALTDRLQLLRSEWANNIAQRPVPWFAEKKVRAGAFATLLALEFLPIQASAAYGYWQAMAIGDTCLFQVRGDVGFVTFPIGRASAFSNAPDLLASNQAYPQSHPQRYIGDWHAGDCFLLMTDALAQWYLEQCEGEQNPWEAIAVLANAEHTEQSFQAWIDQLRDNHQLRNDDVALCIIRIDSRHDKPTPTT